MPHTKLSPGAKRCAELSTRTNARHAASAPGANHGESNFKDQCSEQGSSGNSRPGNSRRRRMATLAGSLGKLSAAESLECNDCLGLTQRAPGQGGRGECHTLLELQWPRFTHCIARTASVHPESKIVPVKWQNQMHSPCLQAPD